MLVPDEEDVTAIRRGERRSPCHRGRAGGKRDLALTVRPDRKVLTALNEAHVEHFPVLRKAGIDVTTGTLPINVGCGSAVDMSLLPG